MNFFKTMFLVVLCAGTCSLDAMKRQCQASQGGSTLKRQKIACNQVCGLKDFSTDVFNLIFYNQDLNFEDLCKISCVNKSFNKLAYPLTHRYEAPDLRGACLLTVPHLPREMVHEILSSVKISELAGLYASSKDFQKLVIEYVTSRLKPKIEKINQLKQHKLYNYIQLLKSLPFPIESVFNAAKQAALEGSKSYYLVQMMSLAIFQFLIKHNFALDEATNTAANIFMISTFEGQKEAIKLFVALFKKNHQAAFDCAERVAIRTLNEENWMRQETAIKLFIKLVKYGHCTNEAKKALEIVKNIRYFYIQRQARRLERAIYEIPCPSSCNLM